VSSVKVYDNGQGDSAYVMSDGYVDFHKFDMEFDTEAQAIAWLVANGWEYAGVESI